MKIRYDVSAGIAAAGLVVNALTYFESTPKGLTGFFAQISLALLTGWFVFCLVNALHAVLVTTIEDATSEDDGEDPADAWKKGDN